MNLHTLLRQREKPIRVGLIGAGKFGTMFLAQLRQIAGMELAGVADLRIDHARTSLQNTGWDAEEVFVTDDASELIVASLDVLVECTGNPLAAATHALQAFEQHLHVVMVTVEVDAVCGWVLRRRADEAGVVYSMAYGDQPALVCELVDWARISGFPVVAAGKGTKHLPHYHYSTPETVIEYYGFSPQQLEADDFNPKMFNSFLDGTKSAIEMAAISNATGLKPQHQGLQFRPVSVGDLAEVLKPKSAGGTLEHRGTVEVVSCLHPDGRPVESDLRWGVYVTFAAPSSYTRQSFADYGLITDKSGEFAALYRPSHLIGLELPVSVASAILRREPTGSPVGFHADVVACAKTDLEPGVELDGEGGFTVYGRLMPAPVSREINALPIGMAAQLKVTRPIQRDGVITFDDVDIAQENLLHQLRNEMIEMM